MRHYLLPASGTDYKANLHCHTNNSDGRKSPEQVREIYKRMGYSIVAYTDHDILLDRSHLCEPDFLALNGFEIEVNEGGKPWDFTKCFHVCLIAKEPDNLVMPCYHRTAYLFGNAPAFRDQLKYDEAKPDFVREYTPQCFAAIAKEAKDGGFFLTYNHPTWSLEDYSNYVHYQGMDAFEFFNGGCIVEGYDDICPRVYDDLLRTGHRIGAIGADDNHNTEPALGRTCDAGVAWTVIRAEKLEYRAVTKALEEGNYYASMGPQIKDLYIEDGKVHISTSPVDRIHMYMGCRRGYFAYASKGETITEAVLPYDADCGYFRFEVTDTQGYKAVTNAYFPDELRLS